MGYDPSVFEGRNVPESVRLRILAARALQQTAGSNLGPYSSRGLAIAQGLLGLAGGIKEGVETKAEESAQARSQQVLAQALADKYGASAPTPSPAASAAALRMPGSAPTVPAAMSGGQDERESYIRQAASKVGIDPDIAVKVAKSEGLGASYGGDNGSSFGPFQLHYGGVAPGGNRVGGLGDDFTKQTGLDARDPSTWKQQVDFSLANAAKGGWGPWHGAQRVGIGNFQGIGGKQASADMPAPNAMPVMGMGHAPGVTDAMWDASAPKPPMVPPSGPSLLPAAAALLSPNMTQTGLAPPMMLGNANLPPSTFSTGGGDPMSAGRSLNAGIDGTGMGADGTVPPPSSPFGGPPTMAPPPPQASPVPPMPPADMSSPSGLVNTLVSTPMQPPEASPPPPMPAPPPAAPMQAPPPPPPPPMAAPAPAPMSPDAMALAGNAGTDTVQPAPMWTGGMGGNDPSSAGSFARSQGMSPAAQALMSGGSAPPPIPPAVAARALAPAGTAPPPAPAPAPMASNAGMGLFGGLSNMLGGGDQQQALPPAPPNVHPAIWAALNDPRIDASTKRALLEQPKLEKKFTGLSDGRILDETTGQTMGGPKSANLQFTKDDQGNIFSQDPSTGKVQKVYTSDGEKQLFDNKGVEGAALNQMVKDGKITPQQAAEWGAGKIVTGPDGAQHFVRPSDAVGGLGIAPTSSTPTAPPQGGVGVPLSAPRPEKLTNDQTNAATYAGRMADAEKVFQDPSIISALQSPTQRLEGKAPVLGNYMTSNQYQMGDQAKRAFVNAVLRKESGAAISQSEFDNAEQQYFPQPGQSADVVAQKAAARAAAIESMKSSAGPAWKAPAAPPAGMPSVDDIRAELARRAAAKAR